MAMAAPVTVDWAVALPVLVASLAPTITGFLQQFSKNALDKAPWYLKSVITMVIGGLLSTVASYAASGDALLSAAGGAILGAVGSMNIALRKGTRGNLEASLQPKAPVE
jgi:hypothetical protein